MCFHPIPLHFLLSNSPHTAPSLFPPYLTCSCLTPLTPLSVDSMCMGVICLYNKLSQPKWLNWHNYYCYKRDAKVCAYGASKMLTSNYQLWVSIILSPRTRKQKGAKLFTIYCICK